MSVELVRAVQNGDREAFNELVLKYQDDVISMCYYYLGNYEDANDVSQDIFIKVFNSIKKFKFKSSFKTWLNKITINTCLTKRKKRATVNKNIRSLDNTDADDNYNQIQISDDEEHILDKLIKDESTKRVTKLLHTLPHKYKEVLLLRYIEEYSNKEIKDILGCSETAVKLRILRAHKYLKDRMDVYKIHGHPKGCGLEI